MDDRLDDSAFLNQLRSDVIAIQATALACGPALAHPVPTCPGWAVGDLLGHLWTVQTWVRQTLQTGDCAQEQEPGDDPVRAVADLADGIPEFLAAMQAIVPDQPCWNFGPPPRLAGFWIRRQVHEHAVHRVDLELALGVAPTTIAAALAADGVDEILSMFYPRQVRMGRTEPVADPLRLSAVDTGQSWLLGEGTPVATVQATAENLYLGLWKRIDLQSNSRITGDMGTVERVLALALTP